MDKWTGRFLLAMGIILVVTGIAFFISINGITPNPAKESISATLRGGIGFVFMIVGFICGTVSYAFKHDTAASER